MTPRTTKDPSWIAAAAFALVTTAALPASAFAQSTLGDSVSAAGINVARPFLFLLVAAAYLCGFWLCFAGLWKMVQSADKGFTHDGAWIDGLMRIAGGGLLCGLPDALNVGIYTFYQQNHGYLGDIAGAQAGGVSDCLAQAATVDIVTCVARNVATNLVPPFLEVTFVMCYIVGIGLVFHCLYKLALSQAHGSRGLQDGWLSRLIIGFLLCNVPYLMQTIEETLGYGGRSEIVGWGAQGLKAGATAVPSLLSYSGANTSVAAFAKYDELIGWCFTILVMFGVFAVWRGITQLKAYSEGNRHGTMGSGLTHIIGGVMLANGKVSTCWIVNTFIGSGLGFCS